MEKREGLVNLFKEDTNIPASWISSRDSSPEVVKKKLHVDFWEAVNLILKPSDHLRKFRSPKESWQRKCGCQGYVIIREGKVIAGITTSVN